ncbi:MAG: ethanolamine utilization acetate kinase EutQ [Spongiibacteraceae bacterium]
MKVLITAEKIKQHHSQGGKAIDVVWGNTIITPEAKDVAKKLGIEFKESIEHAPPPSADVSISEHAIRSAVESKLKPGGCDPALVDKAIAKVMRELNQPVPHCERELASNGVVLVRGGSVQFGRFDGVKDHAIGLTDVITSSDNSSIAAGYMQWEKCSFPWTLEYDEIDIVLEGELHISCDGKTYIGKPGDVFFIPKGASIEFAAPEKVRFVYVTYPADWAGAKS